MRSPPNSTAQRVQPTSRTGADPKDLSPDQLARRRGKLRRAVGKMRRASILIHAVVILPIFFGMLALSIDAGVIMLARSSLQSATDASARYATEELPDVKFVQRRLEVAVGDHKVFDKTPDIKSYRIGAWDAEKGQLDTHLGNDEPDALELTMHSEVDLLVASLIGVNKADVSTTATVLCRRVPGGLGLVALESFEVDGKTRLDSFDSREGQFRDGMSSNHHFTGWTNGDVSLHNGVGVWGDLMMDRRSDLEMDASGFYAGGSRRDLNRPIDLDLEHVPKSAIKMANTDYRSGHTKLPGGNYWFANLDILEGATLEFTGPANVYLRGIANIGGNLITHENNPGNLRVIQASAAPINITTVEKRDWAVDFYSPQGPININGPLSLFGRVQAKHVKMTGGVDFYMDEALCQSDPGMVSVALVR